MSHSRAPCVKCPGLRRACSPASLSSAAALCSVCTVGCPQATRRYKTRIAVVQMALCTSLGLRGCCHRSATRGPFTARAHTCASLQQDAAGARGHFSESFGFWSNHTPGARSLPLSISPAPFLSRGLQPTPVACPPGSWRGGCPEDAQPSPATGTGAAGGAGHWEARSSDASPRGLPSPATSQLFLSGGGRQEQHNCSSYSDVRLLI